MLAQLKPNSNTLYDTDYNLWVLETVKKLQNKDYDSIDLENLIEEVLDLSERKRRKIESLLKRLFEHLLKLKYWESEKKRNKGHWEREILNFRQQIRKELKNSPSLKNHFLKIFEECYQDGRKLALKRSQLPLETFPESPIANIEQVLNENWMP
jgi:hypothetical protein